MKYSNTALKELSAKYRMILKKCFYLNAAILMSVALSGQAMAAEGPGPNESTIGDLTIGEDLGYRLESQDINANSMSVHGVVSLNGVKATVTDTTKGSLVMKEPFPTKGWFNASNNDKYEFRVAENGTIQYKEKTQPEVKAQAEGPANPEAEWKDLKLNDATMKDVVVHVDEEGKNPITVSDLAGYADASKTGVVDFYDASVYASASSLVNEVKGGSISFTGEDAGLTVGAGTTELKADNINLGNETIVGADSVSETTLSVVGNSSIADATINSNATLSAVGKTSIANATVNSNATLSVSGDATIKKLTVNDDGSFVNAKGTSTIDTITTNITNNVHADNVAKIYGAGKIEVEEAPVVKAETKPEAETKVIPNVTKVKNVVVNAKADQGSIEIDRLLLGTGSKSENAITEIENATATISGEKGNTATVNEKIYLGSYQRKGSSTTIKNATLNLNEGAIIKDDVHANGIINGPTAKSTVENATININGAKFAQGKGIYSGGLIWDSEAKSDTQNFNVTFTGNASDGTDEEYASLADGYEGLTIYTHSDGMQRGDKKPRAYDTKGKTATLTFDNYNGKFAAKTEGKWDKVALKNSTVVADMALADGSTFEFDVVEDKEHGVLDGSYVDGTLTVGKDVTLKPVIELETIDPEENTHKFASKVEMGEEGSWKVAENNIYNVEVIKDPEDVEKKVDNGLNSVKITAKSGSEIVQATGGNNNQGAAINAMVAGGKTGNETFDAIASDINRMLQSSDKAEVQQALDAVTALSPDAAPAVQTTSTETANQVFGAVSTRLSGGSAAMRKQGMSGGENDYANGALWGQGIYNRAELDDRGSHKGFDSRTRGFAVGAEANVSDSVKVGTAYAFNTTNVDGFQRDTDVDTHTAILYGEYKPSNWYVNGIASYGWSSYEEDKQVLGSNIKTEYDANTVALQAMTGYEMSVGGVLVSPEAGLRYYNIDQDGYVDETGMKVSGNSSDILTGVVGVHVDKTWKVGSQGYVTPEFNLAATYDLKNDNGGASVTLANGSAYNIEGKALDKFGVEVGTGLTAALNDNVSLSLNYEGKFRQDYQDHTGLLKLKCNF